MKERPILFSAPMVRAILAGQKTQTRRVVKFPRSRDSFVLIDRGNGWWPYQSDDGETEICNDGCEHCYSSPYGQPGDRLLVRETFFAYGRWETRFSAKKGRDEWHFIDMTEECGFSYLYAADNPVRTPANGRSPQPGWHRRPAIFMPRRVVRIFLEVIAARVERLNDISESDCWAEGIEEVMHQFDGESQAHMAKRLGLCLEDAKPLYAQLWESINGAGSWDKNPWVWVVEFKQIQPAKGK